MAIGLIFVSVVLGILGGIAYLISSRVYRGLAARGVQSSKAVGIATFVISFLGMVAIVCTVFILNLNFER